MRMPMNYLRGFLQKKIAHYAVSGLSEASEKYSSSNLSSPIKANLHFSHSRSGVVSFDRVEAVIEISEWVDVPIKKFTMENSTNSSSNPIEEPSGNHVIMEKKLTKRTFRVPLKIEDKTLGVRISLSNESIYEAKSRLVALDKKEADRRRIVELKNNLENYIYATRENLDTSEEFQKISPEEDRQTFSQQLDEIQDWL
ncbi:heat shock 70 kDa protein 17-like [Aristolochia californica]|uniref:heat shock 70 kDa protein 17-like n=1 Tax=Aristolochia californica TaxID=171875 RepID=UPI0035DE5DCF